MSSKITDLALLATNSLAVDDVFSMVDVSDTSMASSGTTKKFKVGDLLTSYALLASPTFSGILVGAAGSFSGNLTAATFTGITASMVGTGTFTGAIAGTSGSFSGTVTSATFSGSGSSITALNASNLASGTVPSARLSLIAGDIPNLSATKITTGTVMPAVLPKIQRSQYVVITGTTDGDGSYVCVNNGVGSWADVTNVVTIVASNPFSSPFWTMTVANSGAGTSNTYTSATSAIEPTTGTWTFASGNMPAAGTVTSATIVTFGTNSMIVGGDANDTILYTANAAGSAKVERYRITGKTTTATHTFTGNASFTGSMSGATGITLAAGTITANAPVFTATATLNNSGVAFTAAKLNVTNSASSATSQLIDLQVGGSSKINSDLSGNVTFAGGLTMNSGNFSIPNNVIFAGDIRGGNANANLRFSVGGATGTGILQFTNLGGYSATSGQQGLIQHAVTYNQASGSGSSVDYTIARTETALGSGSHKFVSFLAGAAGTTEKFYVDNKGSTSLGRLIGNSTAPAIAAGAGAGTSPTIALVGTDLGGQITLTTGTLPTGAAVVLTVTFVVAGTAAGYTTFSPANANAAGLSGLTMVYVGNTTTTFTLTVGATGLTAATQYIWNYHSVW